MEAFIIINVIMGWLCGIYTLWYAFNRANGKKPIRIVMGGIILYFAVMYTLDLFNILTLAEIGSYFLRPFLPLFYLFPVWESRAEISGKGHK